MHKRELELERAAAVDADRDRELDEIDPDRSIGKQRTACATAAGRPFEFEKI